MNRSLLLVQLLLFFTLVISLYSVDVRAKIVGAAVIPHGDFAYDPSLVDYQNGSLQIHNSSILVGQIISELEPELVFISTPHGLALTNDFAVYQNTNGSGYALIGSDLHNSSFPGYKVPFSTPLAPDFSSQIIDLLRGGRRQNVSGLLGFADSEAISLRWGEIIPLTFLEPYLNKSHCQTLVWSQPQRRYTQSVAMIPELVGVGRLLAPILEASPMRIVVIISADLAHTHLASGPYGYSPDAEPFDKACGRWASTLDPRPLLVEAASYVDKALSCGYTGLVTLHGILSEVGTWQPHLYANYHPTYYGMMVAFFQRMDT
jgi:aromatic ring-opening dioxygenase LigB subunit